MNKKQVEGEMSVWKKEERVQVGAREGGVFIGPHPATGRKSELLSSD
jgi:hypothetical protein